MVRLLSRAGRDRPEPLGRRFHAMWSASTASLVGDGIYLTALPLLAAQLTRDPLAISLITFSSYLPWLLLSLPAGVLVDQVDRRRLLILVDVIRAAVITVLTVLVLTGDVSVPIIIAASVVLGTGETIAVTAAQSMLPMVVARRPAQLQRANSRLQASRTVGREFVGSSLGGIMFAVASWIPFLANAVSFAASSAIIGMVRGDYRPAGDERSRRPAFLRDLTTGVRWLRRHRLLLAIAILVSVFNLVGTAWEAILVLFAQDRLGLGDVGFGLLFGSFALGGVLGSIVASWLARRLGAARVITGMIAVEGLATIGLGLSNDPWTAGALMAVLAAGVVIWNVVVASLRQTLIPEHLFGRVNSVYLLFALGATPLGALLGGVVAASVGVRAPFLLGGGVLLLAAVVATRFINPASVAEAMAAAPATHGQEPDPLSPAPGSDSR